MTMIAPIFLFPLPSWERIKVRGCFPSLPADRSEGSLPAMTIPVGRDSYPAILPERSEESPVPALTASRSALHAAGRVHAESGALSKRPSYQAAPCFRPPPSSPAAPPPSQASLSQPPTPVNEHLIAGGALGGSFGWIRAQRSAPLAETHRGGCGAVRSALHEAGRVHAESGALSKRPNSQAALDGSAADKPARVPTSGFTRPPDMGSGRRPCSARRPAQPCGLAAPWLALLCIINREAHKRLSIALRVSGFQPHHPKGLSSKGVYYELPQLF